MPGFSRGDSEPGDTFPALDWLGRGGLAGAVGTDTEDEPSRTEVVLGDSGPMEETTDDAAVCIADEEERGDAAVDCDDEVLSALRGDRDCCGCGDEC